MAFAKSKLLLTSDRETQLTSALANTSVTDPLTTICAEAEGLVDFHLGAYTVADALRDQLVRAVALQQAFSLAEGAVPADIQALYDQAMRLVEQIRSGSAPEETGSNLAGAYGSQTAIAMRTDA